MKRPKSCNCGGRMPTYRMKAQQGVIMPYNSHEDYYEPVGTDVPVPHNTIDANYFKNYQLKNPNIANQISLEPPHKKKNPFDLFDVGLGIEAGSDILAEISGRMDRARQNQYMWNQYSTLGQMNPMPTEDYQPNPYSLYARMGGSMKNIQNYIEMIRKKSKYSGGGGLSRSQDYGSSKKPYPSVSSGDFAGGHRSYPIPTKADAIDALRLAHLHGRSDVIAKVKEKYPDLKRGGKKKGMHKMPNGKMMMDTDMDMMKSGGKWIQKAVNPAHKGFCTPMTKSTCVGRRRQLALLFKKKHGFHK